MSDHSSGEKEKAEFIACVKQLIPKLSSALREDNWIACDEAIIQIKDKAKAFELSAGLIISMEVNDLWEILRKKVEEKTQEHGILNIPEKEIDNILGRVFDWYVSNGMTVGLKKPLEEWIERMEKYRERTGKLPFPSYPSSFSVHFRR